MRLGRSPHPQKLDASDLSLGIIASRFNLEISQRLVEGAEAAIAEHGGSKPVVLWVPGAFELPLVALSLAESGQVDALVAVGCIIRGETAHFDQVAKECASGLMQVSLETGIPCGFGVLSTFNLEQALARSEGENNHGRIAAETAIEMARLLQQLESEPEELIQIGKVQR